MKKIDSDGQFYMGQGADAGKMVIGYSTTASFVHEVTHGGQFHNKEIGLSANGTFTAYDLTDEVNAYKAQVSYDAESFDGTARSPSSIIHELIKNAEGKNGRKPYELLPQGPINVP